MKHVADARTHAPTCHAGRLRYDFSVLVINEEDTAMATCCVGDVKPIMNTWMRLTSTFSNTTSSATKTNLFISDFDSSDDDVYFCLSGNINAVSLYATKLKVKNGQHNSVVYIILEYLLIKLHA